MANTNGKCFPKAYHIQLIPKADSTTRLLDSCTLANLPKPIPFIGRSTSQEFNTPEEAALNWSLIFNDSSKARNREVSTYIVVNPQGKYHTLKNPTWASLDEFTIDELNKSYQQENCTERIVGIAHTHGGHDSRYNSEYFSDEYDEGTDRPSGDLPLADEQGISIYLSTPNDTFRKTHPGYGEDKFYMGGMK